MKSALFAILALSAAVALVSPVVQAQNATKDQAIAMVKKGVGFIKANGTGFVAPIENTTLTLVITDRSKQCVTKDADVRGRGCTSTLQGTLQLVRISDCPGIATASVSSRFETSAEVTWSEPTCDRCTLVGSHQPGVRLTIGSTAVAYRVVPVSSMQAALEEQVCLFEVRYCVMIIAF